MEIYLEEELQNSKSALISSMKSLTDSIGGMSDFYFAQGMSKTNSTNRRNNKKLSKVSIEDIVEAFKDIKLDTIYFLRN